MIVRLRKRMTLLVILVLVLVTAGIIFLINYMNWRNITSQAENALETLALNSGVRPLFKMDPDGPPEKPSDENTASDEEWKDPPEKPENAPSDKWSHGQPPELENALANLSNYYVVTLSSDGTIEEWDSDRKDLYTDEQIQDMTAMVVDSGKDKGHFGTQFFLKTTQAGKTMLIVLDQRLEIMNMLRVLRVSALIASAACVLLCIAAWLLIRYLVRPVQEAFDRQRQFVWDASHELKTPLAVISANAEVLQDEIGKNEYLGYIRWEVKRTNRLVQNLLTLARMDQGKVTADLKEMNLSKALLSVALPFESSAFEEERQFEIEVPSEILCRGDAEMIKQLAMILLSNALKYSDKGDWIRICAGRKTRGAWFQVVNTGEGISKEDQGKIFDRFYRADQSHNSEKEGSGLGLAIAQNIVEMHKGRLCVTSEPKGDRFETIFTVSLPAQ